MSCLSEVYRWLADSGHRRIISSRLHLQSVNNRITETFSEEIVAFVERFTVSAPERTGLHRRGWGDGDLE